MFDYLYPDIHRKHFSSDRLFRFSPIPSSFTRFAIVSPFGRFNNFELCVCVCWCCWLVAHSQWKIHTINVCKGVCERSLVFLSQTCEYIHVCLLYFCLIAKRNCRIVGFFQFIRYLCLPRHTSAQRKPNGMCPSTRACVASVSIALLQCTHKHRSMNAHLELCALSSHMCGVCALHEND